MHWKSARQAIVEAYGARLGSTWEFSGGDQPSPDNAFRIWDGQQKAKVMAVVDRLPVHCRAWIMFAYTDQGTDYHEQVVLDYLIDELDKVPPVKVQSLGGLRRVLRLLYLLIQDMRQREMNGRALYRSADLARAIDEDRREFVAGRYWGRLCDGGNRVLSDLVSSSLGPVAQLVEEMREQEKAA